MTNKPAPDKPVSAEQFYDKALFCDDAELKASMKPHFVKFAEAYASSLREENERLRKERDESASEAAACVNFLQTEMHWESFRGEMLPGVDVPASKKNWEKLGAFLQESGHGLKLLATIARLQEDLREARAQIDANDRWTLDTEQMRTRYRKAESQLESAQANARLWESNANEWKRLANRDKEQLEAIKRDMYDGICAAIVALKGLPTQVANPVGDGPLYDVMEALNKLRQKL